jgi:hypothetical protein
MNTNVETYQVVDASPATKMVIWGIICVIAVAAIIFYLKKR